MSLVFKPQGGGGYGHSPIRADAITLYNWWHGFIECGEGPLMKDLCDGLGWDRAYVSQVVDFIVVRRGAESLPHHEAYKTDVLNGRYRWKGLLHRWAPTGSTQWSVYFYGCRHCGHPKRRQLPPKNFCESCKKASFFVPLDESEPDNNADSAEVLLERRQQIRLILSALDTLSPRKATVLKMRFGLNDGDGETLVEIGKRLGLSTERARQIESAALRDLRKQLENRF